MNTDQATATRRMHLDAEGLVLPARHERERAAALGYAVLDQRSPALQSCRAVECSAQHIAQQPGTCGNGALSSAYSTRICCDLRAQLSVCAKLRIAAVHSSPSATNPVTPFSTAMYSGWSLNTPAMPNPAYSRSLMSDLQSAYSPRISGARPISHCCSAISRKNAAYSGTGSESLKFCETCKHIL